MEMGVGTSNSSAPIPFWQKVSELALLFRMRLRNMNKRRDMSWIFSDCEEYNELLCRYSNVTLERAKVFEIGFGTQPYRLMTLMSLGVDACGVDLDVPVLRGNLHEFLEMYRKNGI